MTTTSAAEATTPVPAVIPGLSGRARLLLAAGIAAAVAAIAALAVLLSGQSGQISRLAQANAAQSRQISQLSGQAQAAQKAAAAAQAAGKTQADATNANLGVCVSVNYGEVGYVNGVTVLSPTRSPGGAVSCQIGTFTPVAPQKAPGGAS
jgi:hypothetical protein